MLDDFQSQAGISQTHDAFTGGHGPASAPPDFVDGIWNERACRGDDLDLTTLRNDSTCVARAQSTLPLPPDLALEPPELESVPHGKMTPFKARLVNHGAERVGFVVTVGTAFPSVLVSKLRFQGRQVEASCSIAGVSASEFYYVELEPDGTLGVEGELYPNDAAESGVDGECTPGALPHGEEYQVELSVGVNQSKLSADWTFKIR